MGSGSRAEEPGRARSTHDRRVLEQRATSALCAPESRPTHGPGLMLYSVQIVVSPRRQED